MDEPDGTESVDLERLSTHDTVSSSMCGDYCQII